MPGALDLRRFLMASIADQLLAIEAATQLLFARLNTLGSARHFTSFMGELDGRPVDASRDQQTRAARIGYIVEKTARVMPFRCVCLQQVLAVRRMLKRRHIPATVFLGVLPDQVGARNTSTSSAPQDAAAHAWIRSGDKVVNGDMPDLGRYVVLGMFS